MSNVVRAGNELLTVFHEANRRYLDGKLPTPEITIQTAGRKVAYGWITVQKVWKNSTGDNYEINICAEYLARELPEVIGTLLHEMAHFWNIVHNIQDTSSHQYHNKNFKAAAEMVGLEVQKSDKFGYAYTKPTKETISFIESINVNDAIFRTFRAGGLLDDGGKPKKKKGNSKMKKWSCGCTNVRCAVELVAVCEKCGNSFELQE